MNPRCDGGHVVTENVDDVTCKDGNGDGMVESRTRLVCVGDVHGQWNAADAECLGRLGPDAVLFVGDFGNEDVEVVQRICELQQKYPVALVFGNHDAFYSASRYGQQRCPYDRSKEDRVVEQLRIARDVNTSYTARTLVDPGNGKSSLVAIGGRPFSWGGSYWKYSSFFRHYLRVTSIKHSLHLMQEAVDSAPAGAAVVLLSHNGPSGLGEDVSSICGKDFGEKPGGDFGDTDLRDGLEYARAKGRRVPLVVFGHMHKRLAHGAGDRTMLVQERNTVMLNTAVVPRIIEDGNGAPMHQFSVVTLCENNVGAVHEVWLRTGSHLNEVKLLFHDEKVLPANLLEREEQSLAASTNAFAPVEERESSAI